MNPEKINVKLFVDSSGPIDLDPFLTVFARWREHQDPSGWVDLADYAHVERGPGVVLIGRQGNLSADLADPGPGLLWANKLDLTGGLEERIRVSFERGLSLFARLIAEPEFPSTLTPRTGFWGVTFNDRLEVPNTAETHRVLDPAVRRVADRLFGPGSYDLIRDGGDDGRRCGMTLHSAKAPALPQLLEILGASAR